MHGALKKPIITFCGRLFRKRLGGANLASRTNRIEKQIKTELVILHNRKWYSIQPLQYQGFTSCAMLVQASAGYKRLGGETKWVEERRQRKIACATQQQK